MTLMKTGLILLIILVLALLGAGAYFLSGGYDVAADRPHTALAKWIFSTTMDHSVERHAGPLQTPALTDSSLLRSGAREFQEMCVVCHGAPGKTLSPIGKGLNPPAPELSEAAGDWSPEQLHWIIRHGIKMSGMPAFGATHGDEEIWGIVAFLRALQGRSPEAYGALLDSLGARSGPESESPGSGHSP